MLLTHDRLTGWERMTISAARMFGSSAVAVPESAESGQASAPTPIRDVMSRLSIKPGQVVAVRGRGDFQIISQVPDATGAALASFVESADVVLYWPSDPETMRNDLAEFSMTARQNVQIWVICARPGRMGCAGPAIPQNDVIAAGRAAGFVDNRVAFLSECEFGYRFARRP